MDSTELTSLLERAVELARPHHPHPNPRVGALIVDGSGEILGRGVHERRGEPHAEVHAIAAAGERARGATMVVTLEPCSHHGATPPCTKAIVAAGIERVFVGAIDPDDRVAGSGIAALRASGVEVTVTPDPAIAEALDEGYFHHRRTGRPLVTLKLAATLDGQTAASDGTSQWITGPAAREDVHRLRSRSDAVMIGGGTLIADDPVLTARLDDYRGPQPVPVVVLGDRPIQHSAAVLERQPIVYTPQPIAGEAEAVVLPGPGGVDLAAAIDDLGRRGIIDLLVEGGATLAASLLRADLVDRFVIYFGAAFAGGIGRGMFGGVFETLDDRLSVSIDSVTRIGTDIRIDARRVR